MDTAVGADAARDDVVMPRILLPPELGGAFRVGDARALGVGEARLRGPDLASPFHGARSRKGPEPTTTPSRGEAEDADLRGRIRDYLPVMPDEAFFAGPTAAFLLGAPLPRGVNEKLTVGHLHPGSAPRRPGIRGVQVLPRMVRIEEHEGMRVSSPASTWAMLGGRLGMFDLVADAFLRVPRHPGGFRPPNGTALARADELRDALDAGRRRGAVDLRTALLRARTGSSSRPETWLRLVLVDGGLPEPELDVDVVGPHGEFLGCSELAYRRERLAIEYESDGHLTRAQLERDIDKYEAYAAAGWRVVRATSTHVFRAPAEIVRRVAAALGDRS